MSAANGTPRARATFQKYGDGGRAVSTLDLAEHGPAYAGELGEPFQRVTATSSQLAKVAANSDGEIHVLSIPICCGCL